jgi:hypothetical protein
MLPFVTLQDVCCQTEPAPTTSAPVTAVSEFSKQLFGGYFVGENPVESEQQSANLFTNLQGSSLNCAAVSGTCTAPGAECPAGSSAGYQYGKAAAGGDCLDQASKCCGSAQQLWAQEGVLVIDVPSTTSGAIPDAPSDAQLTEIRLAAEFKLVLQSLGVPADAFSSISIPVVPRSTYQLRAGQKPKPKRRPRGYESGFTDIVLRL